MPDRKADRVKTLLLLAGGAVLLALLLWRQGAGDVAAVLSLAGWNVVFLALYRIVPLGLDTLGWGALFPSRSRPKGGLLLWARWLAECMNTLLPVAQVGGHFLRAELLRRRGANGLESGATVTVDFTLGLGGQILFILTGIVLLLLQHRPGDPGLGLALGLGAGIVLIGGFYLAQRKGVFAAGVRIFRLHRGRMRELDLLGRAERLDERVAELYGDRSRVLACGLWRAAAWFAKAGETWLFLHFCGLGPSVAGVLIVESLSGAFRSAGFAVPGALGIQDGGVMLAGTLVGLGPDAALALALAKRARELMVGAPGLISLVAAEGLRPVRGLR
jgi:putative membrane protein